MKNTQEHKTPAITSQKQEDFDYLREAFIRDTSGELARKGASRAARFLKSEAPGLQALFMGLLADTNRDAFELVLADPVSYSLRYNVAQSLLA